MVTCFLSLTPVPDISPYGSGPSVDTLLQCSRGSAKYNTSRGKSAKFPGCGDIPDVHSLCDNWRTAELWWWWLNTNLKYKEKSSRETWVIYCRTRMYFIIFVGVRRAPPVPIILSQSDKVRPAILQGGGSATQPTITIQEKLWLADAMLGAYERHTWKVNYASICRCQNIKISLPRPLNCSSIKLGMTIISPT